MPLTIAKCRKCHKPFSYKPTITRRVNTRSVCPKCIEVNKNLYRKRTFNKTNPKEPHGNSKKSGLFQLRIRTEEEVADIMHLSRQRIHQIEISAIKKIRKALNQYLIDLDREPIV